MKPAPAAVVTPPTPSALPAGAWAGVGLFLGALALFATFDAFSKFLLERYPAPFLNVARYTTSALIALIWLGRAGSLALWRTPHRPMLILRGTLLGIVGTCYMTALTWMPLAEATAIYFTSPLIIVALSPWLLGEHVRPRQWLAVCGGCLGMLLIVRPGGNLPLLGTILMCVAAVCYALYQVATRKLAGRAKPEIQYGYMAAICLLVTAIPAPFFPPPVWPDAGDWLLIGALGLCNAAGQLLLLAAFQRAPASLLAPVNYVQLLLALCFSALLFGRTPDAIAGMGIAMIVAAGVCLTLPSRRRAPKA